jgi:hypothetical protein
MSDDDVLTSEDVIEWLKVSRQWVKDHVTRHKPIIPHRRFGRKIRFLRGEVKQFLADQKRDTPTWEESDGKAA